MAAKIKLDVEYFDFLNVVQEISNNLSSIQSFLVQRTLKNYDISHVMNVLDEEINNLNRLIMK
jgi:hypothetical protein